ncbi:MAG: acetyltransferase [Firmicutes bacterium]|nr:acetyltransferase [Bacillota bacterium]
MKTDPFIICPQYETNSFIIRKLAIEDSEDLFLCYSDPIAAKFFNGDNCGDDFFYNDFSKFKKCVEYWIEANNIHDFVRFSIINKQNNKSVGTVEICPSHRYSKGQECIGILRIDIMSVFETKTFIKELYDVLIDNLYKDFEVDFLLTKAILEACARIETLEEHSFMGASPKCNILFDNYYIR